MPSDAGNILRIRSSVSKKTAWALLSTLRLGVRVEGKKRFCRCTDINWADIQQAVTKHFEDHKVLTSYGLNTKILIPNEIHPQEYYREPNWFELTFHKYTEKIEPREGGSPDRRNEYSFVHTSEDGYLMATDNLELVHGYREFLRRG